MCGIFGFSSDSGIHASNLGRLQKSLSTLAHRGPDHEAEYYDEKVYLGHRRLSIIDLSAMANQPFKSFHERAWIIFNGEIYNYKELSRSLAGLTTSSDTEVILEGYLQHGKSFFKNLRGIYAFAIYDCRTEPKLVLYRDLAGIKPLYFTFQKNMFSFASEIKALKAFHPSFTINESILKTYLALGFCLEPNTIYREVRAVEPGECLVYAVNRCELKSELISRYDLKSENKNDFAQNVEKTKELLSAAVQRNLTSDVPISFSLSGGIDSSLVLAHSKGDSQCLCVKFGDQQYDESGIAQSYATRLNKKLTVIPADVHSSLELVNKIFLHFDQPYADSSAIPFYILSKKASAMTKVLLGGDGGDEIQNGYASFRWLPFVHQYRAIAGPAAGLMAAVLSQEYKRALNRVRDISRFRNADDAICTWTSWMPPTSIFNGRSPFQFDLKIVYDTFRTSFSTVQVPDVRHSLIKNFFYKRMLSDYLRKADMMSMMNSLEYRVPMLDEDLVSHSLSIPYRQKSDMRTSKKIFRSIHAEFFSRETSCARKRGFGIPLDQWLTADDFRQMKSTVMGKDSIVLEYIRKEYLEFLFDSLESKENRKQISRAAVYQRILMAYVLQIWYQHQGTGELF